MKILACLKCSLRKMPCSRKILISRCARIIVALPSDIAPELFAEYDLILDGCDNFETRYLVNETANALGKPLISGALSQWEGQLSVFDPANGTPCYQCIFPSAPASELAPACSEAGVIGPLPGCDRCDDGARSDQADHRRGACAA